MSYALLATSSLTKMNKAAIAMFAGTVGWVLYICYGADFVLAQHPREYADFLMGEAPTSSAVKRFIAQNIFLNYVGKGAEIVLFLLATMTIVEILDNNGCFDFITRLMRTRSSKKLMWILTGVTFLISANLDNLTTTTMMLVIMHKMLPNRRQRLIYGSAIVIAANCGGALTVIGDPVGLLLWSTGKVTATRFSMSLLVPCLLGCLTPILWLLHKMPERVDMQFVALPYRGDDTRLNPWQRVLMLFVGIGGLWFIPTFHNITKLSPFLGALCVLSVLWIVNEVVNRKLLRVDDMVQRRTPRVLQYGTIQLMLFVMGIMLAIGVVKETGMLEIASSWVDKNIHNVWIIGTITGLLSSVVDTFAAATAVVSLHDVLDTVQVQQWVDSDYMSLFLRNGMYWKTIAYTAAMGGNIFLIGSLSGLALMKTENVSLWWYFRHVGIASLIGSLMGLLWLFLTTVI